MIYKDKTRYVDAERILGLFRQGTAFVSPQDKEARIALVEFLESENFKCQESVSHCRDCIINSPFPLKIDLKAKDISSFGNVTCSAAAASSKIIMGEKEFYVLYAAFESCKK